MDIEIENIQPTTQAPLGTPDAGAIQHLAIADRFGISNPTQEEENKLMEIWDHAAGLSKSGEITDIIWQVIHLEGVLGAPRLGEERIDRLYRYAKLRRQERQIQSELKGVSGVGA